MKSVAERVIPAKASTILRRIHDRLKVPKPCGSIDGAPANSLRCSIAYNKYGAFCVPLSSFHRPAAQCVLNGKVYEPETISFIRDKCYGKDIVHAGTYFGDFLPPLAEVAGNVWAFEPNPENYQCARITCELNRLANVELVHAALGSSRGSIWLKTEDEEGRSLGGASKVISDVEKVSSSTVDRLPIDEVIPGNCELAVLQLDVEGYEAEALAGALESIRCHRPILVLESIPEEPWFSEHLGPLGYHQTGSVGPNTVLTCDSD